MKNELNPHEKTKLLSVLKTRFDSNNKRHPKISWTAVEQKLNSNPEKLWSLHKMEETGGEPDVVDFDEIAHVFVFIDCSKESPSGRRSLCYDREALEKRKANKPAGNALDLARELGVTLLTEEEYHKYHQLLDCDSKTSSWVLTPHAVREKGGAIFCDFRFGRVFTYHNGADSYYAARGFRGKLEV